MKTEQTHDSSLIEKSIFDDEEKTLTLFFKNGVAYEYSNFDENDYNSFINAPSQGSYFARNIKNSFPYTRL